MVSRWGVPALAVTYYAAMVVFVTYPGYVPFNQIRPFVLGIPFSMFWQVLWICGAIFMLATVFAWERRRRDRTGGHGAVSSDPPTADSSDGGRVDNPSDAGR